MNQPDPKDAIGVLAKVGGFDIAGMAGMFLGGAALGVPVVIDGFISCVAALIAQRICPLAGEYMIASHVSKEPAARLILEALGKEAVIMGKCASVRAAERLRFFRSWIWELLCMIP